MMKGLENKRFKLLENTSSVPIHGVDPGKTVRVEVDAKGNPLERQWRRREKDADKCGGMKPVVEVVEKKTATKKKGAK